MMSPMWTLSDAKHHRSFAITSKQWPVWVHGFPKSGASFATVLLAAQCIRLGERVVFLCAYGEAIRALQQQLELPKPELRSRTIATAVQAHIEDMQLITLKQEKGKSLADGLRALPDLDKRVVIVKNIEDVLTPDLLEVVSRSNRFVLSGDFSKTAVKLELPTTATQIAFSQPPDWWHVDYAVLPTYIGQYWRSGTTGQLCAVEQAVIDKS